MSEFSTKFNLVLINTRLHIKAKIQFSLFYELTSGCVPVINQNLGGSISGHWLVFRIRETVKQVLDVDLNIDQSTLLCQDMEKVFSNYSRTR